MAKPFGHLLRTLRQFISDVECMSYTQRDFLDELAARGELMSHNTFSDAENSKDKHERVINQIAAAFSDKIRNLWVVHAGLPKFDPLRWYSLAFIFDRLQNDANPTLMPEHIVMNRVDRFLVGYYGIRLAVAPCIGSVRTVVESGDPEILHYDNIAKVTYELRFAEDNRRKESGFTLRYTTKKGRIEAIDPKPELIRDRNYHIHKTGVHIDAAPDAAMRHRLEILVYGGYDPDQETAHFSMAEEAIYDEVSFTLDLSAYPENGFTRFPELIIVPRLKNSDRDCCQIARDGDGLVLKPRKSEGLIYSWQFEGVSDVMICIRWQTNQKEISESKASIRGSLDHWMDAC